jgi:hypothetical protein
MAMRFHIAICVVTPLELLTLLAVHFAVGLTTNIIIPSLKIVNHFSKLKINAWKIFFLALRNTVGMMLWYNLDSGGERMLRTYFHLWIYCHRGKYHRENAA